MLLTHRADPATFQSPLSVLQSLCHSHLEFVFQLTRVLPKDIGTSVQNLSHLLNREKALLPEHLDDAVNVPLMHGENFGATVKHPL